MRLGLAGVAGRAGSGVRAGRGAHGSLSVSQSVISRSRPALTPPPARSPAPPIVRPCTMIVSECFLAGTRAVRLLSQSDSLLRTFCVYEKHTTCRHITEFVTKTNRCLRTLARHCIARVRPLPVRSFAALGSIGCGHMQVSCDTLLPLLARSPAILEHLLARHTPIALRPRTHTQASQRPTRTRRTAVDGGLPPRASARTYTTRRRSHVAASSARSAGGFGGVLICTQLAARAPHAPVLIERLSHPSGGAECSFPPRRDGQSDRLIS